MENNKSPGIDGIPIKFYKEFLAHIENDLLQLYQNILQNEKKKNENHETSHNNTHTKKGRFTKTTILETNISPMHRL